MVKRIDTEEGEEEKDRRFECVLKLNISEAEQIEHCDTYLTINFEQVSDQFLCNKCIDKYIIKNDG